MSAPVEKIGLDTYKFENEHVRVQISYHSEHWKIEELSVKGKKELRIATCDTGSMRGRWNNTYFFMIFENVWHLADVQESDDYAMCKMKLETALGLSKMRLINEFGDHPFPPTEINVTFNEKKFPAAHVAPLGYERTIQYEGADFSLECSWDRFKAYSPGSDLQNHDPSYSAIVHKTSASARKLCKLLKSKAEPLKNVKFSDLDAWLRENKIAYEWIFSVWH